MPLAPPFELMLWNVSPLAPIVALLTLSAVAVVVVRVFTTAVAPPHGFTAQTLTVPPLVAMNAAFVPVVSVMPPLNEKVDAVLLLVSETPAPDVTLSEPA